jgi:hypothetical protein
MDRQANPSMFPFLKKGVQMSRYSDIRQRLTIGKLETESSACGDSGDTV